MSTIVELVSPTDTITFYHAPVGEGWVYNNATLAAWYALPKTDPKHNKRPNAHGTFGLGKVYVGEHRPIINGQYYGASPEDALVARDRLNAMFNDGESILMRVTDSRGTQTREVWLLEADTDFHYDFSHFPLDVVFSAPDPRRYGAEVNDTDTMPEASGGLHWDLGTAPSGLFWDWGDAGVLGQVSFTNAGNATTFPRIEVGGEGSFAAGFRVTEIETGRELTFERVLNEGDLVIFDSRTQRATLGNGDVTGALSSRDWFEIPKGQTRRYQINPLGAVAGSPTITIYAAPASL